MSALSSIPTRHAPEGSPEKGARLEELESTIEAGLKTFVEVGRAIREINDSRLYREQGFDTFEKYCRERWGWSRSHAYRQMEAANAAEIVSPIGDIPNEGVARELTPLRANPEAVREVYAAVLGEHGDKLTASDLRQAVRERVEYRDYLEKLPEKTRATLEMADESYDKHRNLLRNSNQLEHLANIAIKQGDALAAEVAERALSEDGSSTFKAYEEMRREQDRAERESRREAHRATLHEAPPLDRRYEVVVADPPWRYDHSETDSRRIENHYPTMDLEEIKALDVPAEEDAVVFVWSTSPKLAEALEVMEAWGFNYRTSMIWVKDRIGMGYHARNQHEFVLIGKRGNPPVPEPANRPSSVFHAARTEHSSKPEIFYEIVESMYPDRSKVDLFARGTRPGFDSWGNEVLEAAS